MHRSKYLSFFYRYSQYLSSLFLPFTAAFFAIPYLVSSLSNNILGHLTLAWVFFTFATNFDFGSSRQMARDLVTKELSGAEREKFICAGYFLQLCIAIACSIVIFICTVLGKLYFQNEFLKMDLLQLFSLIFVGFIPSSVFALFRFVLESEGQTAKSAFFAGGLNALVYLLPCFLWSVGMQSDYLLVALFFVRMMVVFVLVGVFGGISFSDVLRGNWNLLEILSTQARGASWMALYSFSALVTSYTDKLVVGIFFPIRFVAAYNIPVDFLQRANIFPALAIRVLNRDVDIAVSSGRVKKVFDTGLLFSCAFYILCIGFAFATPTILELWLGPAVDRLMFHIGFIVMLSIALSGFNYFLINFSVSTKSSQCIALVNFSLLFPFAVGCYFFSLNDDLIGVAKLVTVRSVFEFFITMLFSYRQLNICSDGLVSIVVAVVTISMSSIIYCY